MLFLRLWNYIRGYVIILVDGYFLEKFINICVHRQIFLWDVRRLKNSDMALKISIKGFKMLRPVARKTKCSVRIVKKCGLPFILSKYRRRKTFLAGAILFIVIIYILSSFIWAVEVKGNDKVSTQAILNSLAEMGVKPGIIKYNINTDRIVNEIMLRNHDFTWVGIIIKGTKLKIEVVESIKPPELVPKDVPCDIIADRDGVIKSIIVKAGKETVKEGDTVIKGQVLVTGVITVKKDEKEVKIKTVHSMGTVTARTWYEGVSPVVVKKVEKHRTGKSTGKYSLILFAKRFNLFSHKAPYENYEKIEIKKSLSFGENFVFPFGLIIDKYYENRLIEKEISIEDARQEATDKAYKAAVAAIPHDAEIISTKTNFVQNGENNITEVHVVIECTENIGISQKIGGN